MIDLLDAALQAAKDYAHDPDADQVLEDLVRMDVFEVEEGRAINVLLSSDDDQPPAIGRIAIETEDGIVGHDMEELDDEEIADLLIYTAKESLQRVAFCREALQNMGISASDISRLLRS